MTLTHTIILQTLSRLHVCATLAFSQIIGSICVMVARATAPNRIGPESVFPDAGTWDFQTGLKGSPLASAPFWIALTCQLVIVIGYFWFYRKEQLGESTSLFCPRSSMLTCCTSTSMMAISFLYLPCTYSGFFFNFGLLDSFCVVEHCIWAFAIHILFILHRTGYMDPSSLYFRLSRASMSCIIIHNTSTCASLGYILQATPIDVTTLHASIKRSFHKIGISSE